MRSWLGWDLKLSPMFSVTTVFSGALSPIGHWSLTTIINRRAFVSCSSSCSYMYRAIEIPPTWCPIIMDFAGRSQPTRP